jgi:pimeloyl-ACP methyl ester carboxylesterase
VTATRTARSEILAAGHRLEVARVTTGSDRHPIVMLHEGLGSIDMWRDFPQQLASTVDRDVVVYSRYGHGRSDALRERREVGYMQHEARVALPEVLAALGIAQPVLFGHSDGASIALIYAATFPGASEGLVLEAPHVFVEPLTVASIANIKEQAAKSDVLAKLARYHDDAPSTFWGWNNIWLDPDFLAWDITGTLTSITEPILMIQGRDDEYGSPQQLAAVAEAVPESQSVLLEAGGHSPHRADPNAVLELTRAFLRNRA